MMYLSLHRAAAGRNGLRAGFIHLPSLPQQRINGRGSAGGGMDLSRQVQAVAVALGVVAAAVASEDSYG
jgi:pyrrolidone-carboxylate peptidase